MKKILFLFSMAVLFVTTALAQCEAPTNVHADVKWNKVSLTWNSVLQDEVDFTDMLTYGTTQSTGIGYDAAGVFSVAIRFPVDSLSGRAGQWLTHVGFTPYQTTVTQYTIQVYVGCEMDNSTFNPGTLVSSTIVYPDEVTALQNSIIRLTTPVQIDGTEEIMIAYECQATGGFPAGAGSNATVVDMYNNILYDDEEGWIPLSTYESLAGYSWCINGYFSELPEITGFNVLRDNEQINQTPVLSHNFVDTSVVAETDYCYVIQSICASGTPNSEQLCVTTPEQPDCAIIGDGTTTAYNIPFNTYYKYSYVQEIFTAEELENDGGLLNSISFEYFHATPITQSNLIVFVAQVDKTSFTSTTDWVPASALTQVYNGNLECSNENENIVTIPFDEPFEYDGESDLVVAFLNNRGAYDNSDPRFYTHTTTDNKVLAVNNDGSAYDILSPGTGTLSSSRNNMQFCFSPLPTCFYPVNLTVDSSTADGAILSWSRHDETDSQWEVVVVEAGGYVEDGTPIMANDTTITLTGLEENTLYDVYIRTVCSSEDMGMWRMISFRTLCVSTHEGVPYVENFTGYGTGEDAFPYCWRRFTNHATTTYPYIISDNGIRGQLYLFSNAQTYSLAVSQPLDLSAYPAGSLALSYRIAQAQETYGRLDVGTMTDPNDMSTFTLLKSYYPSDYLVVTQFQEEEILLPEAYPDIVYLAFLAPKSGNNTSNYTHVTAVKVDLAKTCTSPANLSISHVEGTSAELQWDEAPYGVENYIIAYGDAEDNMTEITVSGNSHLLTNLVQGTEYQVMLYSECAEGESDTLTGSFTTREYLECTELDTNAREITSATPGTANYIPVNNYYNYSYSQQIFTANEISPNHTSTVVTGLALEYSYSTASTDKTNVKVYLAHKTDSVFSSTTNWVPIADATLVYEGHMNCSQGWNVFNFDTYFTYNGNDNLVLIVDDNSGDYNGSSYVFNTHTTQGNKTLRYNSDSTNPDPENPPTGTLGAIRNDIKFYTCADVQPVSCVAPRIFVTETTPSSISVACVANGSESGWNMEYKASSDTDWNSAGSVTTSPYTISGLDPSMQYDIRVQANCGSSESDWVYVSAQTTCELVDLPVIEDFDDYETNAFMDCWKRHTNVSTATPNISIAQAYSGTKSLYFNCASSGNYAYAVAPGLLNSIEMNNLDVMFYAYTATAGYFIEVGVMSDPNDITTFVPVGQYNTTAANTWELAEIITAGYTGNGHYIAFRVPQWYANTIYIDDVNIDLIPTCYHVSDIEFSDITPYSASVSWTAGGDETQWNYAYGIHGSVDLDEADILETSDNPLELTDLAPNTLYDIYIRAYCSSSDQSRWIQASFRTDCAAMTALPYEENFDSYTIGTSQYILPSCWTKINAGTTSSYPYINHSSTYAASGENSLYFYNYNSTSYSDQYAVLPEIDTNEYPINTLQLTFDARSSSTSYPLVLQVGVMTDPTDASTFQLVKTVTITGTAYTDQEVFFNTFAGNGAYIAIKCAVPTTYYNYGYVDNIVVDEAPACSPVNHLTVSNIRGSSALISWESGAMGDIESYTLEYSEAGQDSWSVVSNDITTLQYLLGGLDPETAYEVRVKTNCADNVESVWVTENFTTRCLSGGNLEIGGGMETSGYFPSYSLYNYSYTQEIFTAAELGGATNISSISFEMSAVTNQRTIDVYLMHTDQTEVTTWIPATSAQLMCTITQLSVGMNTFDFNTPFAYDGTNNLVLIFVDRTGSWSSGNNGRVHTGHTNCSRYKYQDDSAYSITNPPAASEGTASSLRLNVMFGGSCDTEIPCLAPNMVVNNVTQTSADVIWVAGYDETQWEMEYTVASDSDWVSVSNLTGGTITIDGLEANTPYIVRMRSICDSASAWISATFRTECGVQSIPFTEDFNSYGTGTTVFPSCWTRDNNYSTTTEYPYVTSTNNSGTSGGSLYYYSSAVTHCIAVTPELDADLSTLAVSFYLKGSVGNGMIVGVLTEPNDFDAFEPLDTVYLTTTDFELFEVYLDEYEGEGKYIGFKNINTTAAASYLDDLDIYVAPNCRRPSGLTVTAVTENSVTLSWVAGGSESAWELVYGTPGFDPDAETPVTNITTPTYEVTGLNSTTAYEFYVRANCGSGEVGLWSGSVSATTNMVAVDMPYSTDFSTADWKLNNGTCVNKWKIGVPADSTNAALFVTDDNNTAHYTITTACVVSAEKLFNMTDADSVNISFDVTAGGESSWDYIKVFLAPSTVEYEPGSSATYAGNSYSENAMNFSAYQASYPYKLNLTSGRLHVSVNMPNPSPNGQAKLVFVWKNDSSGGTQPSAVIENVTVQEAEDVPVCNAPTNVTATEVSKNSAVINWEQEGTPDSWTVSYKKNTADTWTTVEGLTSHPYTLTNLDPETVYNVSVKAVCGTLVSAASATINFETLPDGVDVYANNTVLYPNPTTGQFTIYNEQCVIENVEVYDVYGKLLNSVEVNDNKAVLDVTGYASGVYFTRIYTDKGMVVKQIVKK